MKAGWEEQALGELCEFRNGLWKGKKEPFTKAFVIRNTNFTKSGVLNDSDIAELDVETKQLAKRQLELGDIILEKSGGGPKQPVGRVIPFEIAEGTYSFSNFTSAIRVQDKTLVDPTFLHRFLHFVYLSGRTIDMQKRSTGIRNLDFDAYKAIPIPLPPLEEQERIVAVLDEAFAALDRARTHAETNLKNARELYESYLASIFSDQTSDWTIRSFGDNTFIKIVDGDRGANYPKKADFLSEGHCLFLNTKNVRPDGFNFDAKMFITEEKDKALRKGKLERRDVVLTTRGTIGNIALYDDTVEFEDIRINSGMLILRPNEEIITSEYLFELLRSNVVKSQIDDLVSGAAQPQLPIKSLVKFEVPVPNSLAEQNGIVGKLHDLSEKCVSVTNSYIGKLSDMEDLRQSLLQRAFAGELT